MLFRFSVFEYGMRLGYVFSKQISQKSTPMSASSPESCDSIPASSRPRVLVVDDSRVMRKAITKILDKEYDLIEATDGKKGWETLEQDEQIQVIISDVEMASLDGYSLICRIRAHDAPRIREIPVIIITGTHDEETKEHAYACGASDFITKPLDSVQLRARVRAHAKFDQTTRALADTQAALEDQATLDPLTGLCSRRYFLQRGNQDIAYARRHGNNLSVIRLNIDKFRPLYKKYGDEFSDQLLQWITRILTAQCRTEDTVARIGGAEFAILAPATGHTEAAVLCNRLLAAVSAEPYRYDGESMAITVSMSLINYTHVDNEQIDELLTLAELVLSRAKHGGGNKIEIELREEIRQPDYIREPEEITKEEPTDTMPDHENGPMSVDEALKMVQKGEYQQVEPHLFDLIVQILPLLKVGNNRLGLGLGFAIEALKEKLAGLK